MQGTVQAFGAKRAETGQASKLPLVGQGCFSQKSSSLEVIATQPPLTSPQTNMLYLSQVLIANQDLESFEDLLVVVQEFARRGERFLNFDVKPPYPDTPDNWEDRIEAAFSGRI